MQSRMLKRVSSLAVLAVCTGTAWAGPEEAATGQPSARQQPAFVGVHADTATAVPARPATADTLGFGPAADLGKLERSRGGTDAHNNTNLSGIVTDNSAVNVVTGNNVIDAGSFANMSGIPVVIQNSGANVLIQNSTVVNLQMK